MKLSIYIFLGLIFYFQSSNEPNFIFKEVDEHARSIAKTDDFKTTAEQLTAPFESEAKKARAIYIWLTENISYDISKFNRQITKPKRERITANSIEELELIKQKHRIDLAEKAFHSEKGVCEDYAYLFEFMCAHVGLEARFIPGYGRFSPQEIDRPHRGSNHAWNAVRIDGKWWLLDATWAAGTTDMRTGTFTKDFKEGLFMTDPELFILTHFPDDPAWQLLDEPIDKVEFTGQPYAFPALSDEHIVDYFPKSGILSKKGKFIRLGLKTADRDLDLVLVENRYMTSYNAVYKQEGYVFNIPSKNLKAGELTIAVIEDKQLKPIISYLVKN